MSSIVFLFGTFTVDTYAKNCKTSSVNSLVLLLLVHLPKKLMPNILWHLLWVSSIVLLFGTLTVETICQNWHKTPSMSSLDLLFGTVTIEIYTKNSKTSSVRGVALPYFLLHLVLCSSLHCCTKIEPRLMHGNCHLEFTTKPCAEYRKILSNQLSSTIHVYSKISKISEAAFRPEISSVFHLLVFELHIYEIAVAVS